MRKISLRMGATLLPNNPIEFISLSCDNFALSICKTTLDIPPNALLCLSILSATSSGPPAKSGPVNPFCALKFAFVTGGHSLSFPMRVNVSA